MTVPGCLFYIYLLLLVVIGKTVSQWALVLLSHLLMPGQSVAVFTNRFYHGR